MRLVSGWSLYRGVSVGGACTEACQWVELVPACQWVELVLGGMLVGVVCRVGVLTLTISTLA